MKKNSIKRQSNYLMTIIACMAILFVAIFITSNLNLKGTYSQCYWNPDWQETVCDDTPSGGSDDGGGQNSAGMTGGSATDGDSGWIGEITHPDPDPTPYSPATTTPRPTGAKPCAGSAGTPCMRNGQQGTVLSDCSCSVSGGSDTPTNPGSDTPSCNVGGSCTSGGRHGTYLSNCTCYVGSDAGSSPADPTPGSSTPNQSDCEASGKYWYDNDCHASKPNYSSYRTEVECDAVKGYWYNGKCNGTPDKSDPTLTVADCTFGTPSQNSAGGYFADVDCGPGGTSSLEEQACVSKGWSYRSGQCYYGGKIKFVGDDNEYAWTSPLGEGNCPPDYVWNASISMCLDRLCDCGQGDGDCEKESQTFTPGTPTPGPGGSTPSGGGDYPVPVDPTPEDYVPESDRCFECTVGSEKSYVIAGSAAAARSSSGGTNCIVTFSSNCVKKIKCYECKVGSSNKYTKAYDSSEAATVTGGTNCTEKSMSACNPGSSTIDNPTTYCFACVTNGEYKYTKANDASEAASVTRGINCTIVSMNSCNTGENVIVNPKTGGIVIVVAWILSIMGIGYIFWYFKRTKELNK